MKPPNAIEAFRRVEYFPRLITDPRRALAPLSHPTPFVLHVVGANPRGAPDWVVFSCPCRHPACDRDYWVPMSPMAAEFHGRADRQQWTMEVEDGGGITLSPSIGHCPVPCPAGPLHFWVRGNRIEWLA